jgi:hypothetical protein
LCTSELHRDPASFEALLRKAPQDEVGFCWHQEIPHPEVLAERASKDARAPIQAAAPLPVRGVSVTSSRSTIVAMGA